LELSDEEAEVEGALEVSDFLWWCFKGDITVVGSLPS